MSGEGRDRELPHRVRAATQAGPAQSTAPVLSEELRQRMQEAVHAERGATKGRPDDNAGRALQGGTSGLTDAAAANSAINGANRASAGRPDRQRTGKIDRVSAAGGRAHRDTRPEREARSPEGNARTGTAARSPSGPPPVQAGKPGRRRTRARLRALALALVVIALGVVVIRVFGPGHGGLDSASTSEESSARSQAATWVAQQVSPSASVSCDQVMCAALKADGFSGNLVVLGPTSPEPPDSTLVVVTPAVQSVYGTSLSSAWAPSVLASFGSGTAEISVRVVAPHGVVPFQAQAKIGMANRKSDGTVLLNQSQITLSASAEQQIEGGLVDQRLVVALEDLASAQPINILDFANNGPGAGQDVPLRVADLAATDQEAHMNQGPYVRAMHNHLNAEYAQYRPASSILTLPGGQVIFRVVVSAPSPLGSFSQQSS